MDEPNVKNKLTFLLKNQSLLEAKNLLEKLEKINDLSDIVSDQWLQLGTNVDIESASRIIAFVQAEATVGLGPVLMIQVE